MNSEELGCNDLEKISKMIASLRLDILFDFDEAGMEAIAEQHYLLSIEALHQAQTHMKIAHIHQMRATI